MWFYFFYILFIFKFFPFTFTLFSFSLYLLFLKSQFFFFDLYSLMENYSIIKLYLSWHIFSSLYCSAAFFFFLVIFHFISLFWCACGIYECIPYYFFSYEFWVLTLKFICPSWVSYLWKARTGDQLRNRAWAVWISKCFRSPPCPGEWLLSEQYVFFFP